METEMFALSNQTLCYLYTSLSLKHFYHSALDMQ